MADRMRWITEIDPTLSREATHLATQWVEFDASAVQGALVFYCSGCMLAIPDRIPEVVSSLNGALDHAPFLCSFTLGEQGCFIEGENRHGNLMIAVLAFGPMDGK